MERSQRGPISQATELLCNVDGKLQKEYRDAGVEATGVSGKGVVDIQRKVMMNCPCLEKISIHGEYSRHMKHIGSQCDPICMIISQGFIYLVLSYRSHKGRVSK